MAWSLVMSSIPLVLEYLSWTALLRLGGAPPALMICSGKLVRRGRAAAIYASGESGVGVVRRVRGGGLRSEGSAVVTRVQGSRRREEAVELREVARRLQVEQRLIVRAQQCLQLHRREEAAELREKEVAPRLARHQYPPARAVPHLYPAPCPPHHHCSQLPLPRGAEVDWRYLQ